MLQADKAQLFRTARISRGIAKGHRQAATYQHVKANQLAVFGNGNKVQIVGMHINIIVWRDHHCGFKLTWQVGITQHRLGLGGFNFFLIQPDLSISAGFRQQMFADLYRPLIRLLM